MIYGEANPSLTVGGYFGKISEFLSLAPDVLKALGRFIELESDNDARRSLNSMINVLESMGCEKFIVEFHSILDSHDRMGNWRLAGTQARGIRDGFNDFNLGILKAKRKKDDGGIYDVTLPLDEAIRLLDQAGTGGKPIILAVDDSPVILQSVNAVLGGEYKVLTLPKPTEISKVLERQTPDLFLLDYHMPELSGFELIPIIRSYEKQKDTPIVFLTSDGTIDNLTAALTLGAQDFIVKPFKPDILREKVGKPISRDGGRKPSADENGSEGHPASGQALPEN